eukprot:gene32640-42275_t
MLVPLRNPHFNQFQWNGRSEDTGTPDARIHIEAQPIKFGVQIGGYKVGARESLSVLFEFKSHDSVLQNGSLADFEPQAELELFAAGCVSDQPGSVPANFQGGRALDEMDDVVVAEFLASTAGLQFKKTKLSHNVGLAWEQFKDMANDTEPKTKERAELSRLLFSAMDVPMPSIL